MPEAGHDARELDEHECDGNALGGSKADDLALYPTPSREVHEKVAVLPGDIESLDQPLDEAPRRVDDHRVSLRISDAAVSLGLGTGRQFHASGLPDLMTISPLRHSAGMSLGLSRRGVLNAPRRSRASEVEGRVEQVQGRAHLLRAAQVPWR
jgi:hypothetical protein